MREGVDRSATLIRKYVNAEYLLSIHIWDVTYRLYGTSNDVVMLDSALDLSTSMCVIMSYRYTYCLILLRNY